MKRSPADSRYVYWWADGVHASVRGEADARQCLLVIIGVRLDGKKELVTIGGGMRESKAAWLELLRDLKARGLEIGPRQAVGDGALGFWGALDEVYPESHWQRCWVHKTANVLNALPKSLQAKAKAQLHEDMDGTHPPGGASPLQSLCANLSDKVSQGGRQAHR